MVKIDPKSHRLIHNTKVILFQVVTARKGSNNKGSVKPNRTQGRSIAKKSKSVSPSETANSLQKCRIYAEIAN